MPKENIITALDIGTDSIKGLVAFQRPGFSDFEILAHDQRPSLGIRKGKVVEPEDVSKNINLVLTHLQQQIEQEIEEVYVSLNGSYVSCAHSHTDGIVVSRADRKISEEDINRVIQKSTEDFLLPPNHEILEIIPKEFIVDKEKKIKRPLGMQGVNLGLGIIALYAFSPFLKNLTDAVTGADFKIADVILSPLAAAKAVLTPQQKEIGVALVNIGAGTTSIAVYDEGDLVHTKIIPAGSALITYDVAIGFKTELEIAEKLKREFGACLLNGNKKIRTNSKKDKIVLKDYPELTFSRNELIKIINARVSQIFAEIQKELKGIPSSVELPAGVVFTGGGSKIPKLVELSKQELDRPSRIGYIQGFPELEREPSMSTACGLILSGSEVTEGEGRGNSLLEKISGISILSKIKKIFKKTFLP